VPQNPSRSARLFPKLVTQLVPAAAVTAVGVLVLSNLAKAPDAAPVAMSVPVPIKAEAVFTATPRQIEEPSLRLTDDPPVKAAAARIAAKPKVVAVNAAPPRKPADERRQVGPQQVASVPAPLPIVQVAERPQAPAREGTVMGAMMGRVWGATTTVAGMPYRAAQSVAGWFAAATPPRPPGQVPADFQAAM